MATFGVEIECFMPRGMTHNELATKLTDAGVKTRNEIYNHQQRPTWKVVTDGSLGDYYRGAELVSPVLSTDGDGFAQIRAACKALTEISCTVRRTCGLHVHVGVPNATMGFFKRLTAMYAKYEAIIDTLLASSRRGSSNEYCRPVTYYNDRVQRAESVQELRHINRYFKLNIAAYWRHGTVEFRAHQGTTDGDKAVAWANLCLGMVAQAQKTHAVTGLPMKPSVPASNLSYQRHLDRAEQAAGNHIALRAQRAMSTGTNTYAKMLRRYIDALLACDNNAEHPATLDGLFATADLAQDDRAFFARRQRELAQADQRRMRRAA